MPSYTTGIPSNGLLEVGISMVLRDRFSQPAMNMQSAVRRLNQEAKMANTANLEAASGIVSSLGSMASNAFSRVWDAVKQGAEYIDTMTTVGAITEATKDQLKGLSEQAQSIGLDTMFSSMDIASGMKYLAMAGNGVQEIQDMIESTAYVAGATGMALGGKGGAADMVTNVMKSFKKEGKAAAEIMGDQLTKATLSSNISMQDLAESIKYSAADLVSLKRELPEVAAMIGTLGNAGIQGSMAGVALSNMARYLNKALVNKNSSQYKALAELGITLKDVTDANGDLISFAHILGLIKDATAGMDSMQVNDVLNRIFGVRGFRAANALMHDLEGLNKLEYEIANNSQGYAQHITETRMKTLAGSIEIMRGAWEYLKTSFTEALEPLSGIIRFVGKILDLLRKIFDIPFLGTLIAGGSVVVPLVTMVFTPLLKGLIRIRMMQNDTQIGFRNMLRLMMGGWKAATASASSYAEVLSRIKFMTAASGLGMGPMFFGGGIGRGKGRISNVRLANQYLNKDNQFFRSKSSDLRFRTTSAGNIMLVRGTGFTKGSHYGTIIRDGQWVGSDAAKQALKGSGFTGIPGMNIPWVVNPSPRYHWKTRTNWNAMRRAARINSFSGGMGTGAAAAARGWGAMGGALKGFAGAAGAFLGGPLGIGLLAVGLLSSLPGIIDSIGENIRQNRKLKAELEKNTYSVHTLAGQFQKESERRAANINLDLKQEMMLLRNSIRFWAEKLANMGFQADVYLDGRYMEKALVKANSQTRQNTGTK